MKIAIVGTGLIGASLGLALKAAKSKDVTIVGTDKNHDAAVKARKMGALDKAERRILAATDEAELVILAAPVMAIKELMEFIGPHLSENCVVTDTGSTKTSVLAWAGQHLPPSVNFVGGHPITGKDTTGPDAADADLFKGRTYCLVPHRRASREAVHTVVQMVEQIGAKPFFLNAEEHDSYAAAVSHMPAILSAALVQCASRSPSWKDIAKVAAAGYESITTLASTNPEMNRDVVATNPEGVVYWIDEIIQELTLVRDSLTSDGDSLEPMEQFFTGAWEERIRWLSGSLWRTEGPGIDKHSFGDQMGELLLGRKLMDMYKKGMRRGEKEDLK